ncbi:lambda-exonuclease family protein [Streptomyces sp. N35]|uniref:YqaJ viral recombinase family nuclease n=1 Tax=Streptomyces sp. N35 TaxID=2795730 RepID=UPI0027DCDE47|nr:YqaJ viral recombinase family protein [Streptomyces sp. N35]
MLLGRFEPGTREWVQARAGLTVTATDVAAVVGLSPWQSRFSLWHHKAGLAAHAVEQTADMEWGTRLEPVIAQKFADMHPELDLHTTGTWRHAERTWQRATPDRILTQPGCIPSLLEIKTARYDDAWGAEGTDEIPVHYRCQIMWQLDTLGLRTAHVALLVAGSEYHEYRVEYDQADAELLRDAAEEFLASIRDGVRPDIDGSTTTYDTVRRLHEGRQDIDVEIPRELAHRYQAHSKAHSEIEQAKRQAAAEILDLIGTGRRAVCDDVRIATRTVRGGKTYSLLPARPKKNGAAA